MEQVSKASHSKQCKVGTTSHRNRGRSQWRMAVGVQAGGEEGQEGAAHRLGPQADETGMLRATVSRD
jgi:hypothetical protein